MKHYTLDQLRKDGPQYAMAMLLDCLKVGKPFVTYNAIREELQYQLKIDTIFPTQIGNVAGSLMNQILKVDPKAPLINSMITSSTGIPGKGVGDYFANKYNEESYRKWDKISLEKKRELLYDEYKKILRYPNWSKINLKIYGPVAQSKLRKKKGSEIDGFSNTGKKYGGPAESEEHKKLKEWVAAHPQKLGLRKSFGKGTTESNLPSGDIIDVLFTDGKRFVTVEVKSCRSNDDYFHRGIYQCLKYKKVKEAQLLPHKISVQALLVTERELNSELKIRARLLEIDFKCVSVN